MNQSSPITIALWIIFGLAVFVFAQFLQFQEFLMVHLDIPKSLAGDMAERTMVVAGIGVIALMLFESSLRAGLGIIFFAPVIFAMNALNYYVPYHYATELEGSMFLYEVTAAIIIVATWMFSLKLKSIFTS